jgi:hypothetical protein
LARFKFATPIVHKRAGVEVASAFQCASKAQARQKFARTVVLCCICVIVARSGDDATKARHRFARPIVLIYRGVVVARPRTAASRNHRHARSVVLGGLGVVVQRGFIGATVHLELVAHAVTIRVNQALAVAVVSKFSKHTLAAGHGGVGVVVAGEKLGASYARLVIA